MSVQTPSYPRRDCIAKQWLAVTVESTVTAIPTLVGGSNPDVAPSTLYGIAL